MCDEHDGSFYRKSAHRSLLASEVVQLLCLVPTFLDHAVQEPGEDWGWPLFPSSLGGCLPAARLFLDPETNLLSLAGILDLISVATKDKGIGDKVKSLIWKAQSEGVRIPPNHNTRATVKSFHSSDRFTPASCGSI